MSRYAAIRTGRKLEGSFCRPDLEGLGDSIAGGVDLESQFPFNPESISWENLNGRGDLGRKAI